MDSANVVRAVVDLKNYLNQLGIAHVITKGWYGLGRFIKTNSVFI